MQSLHSHLWENDQLKLEATPKLLKLINGKGQNKKQGVFKFAKINKHPLIYYGF